LIIALPAPGRARGHALLAALLVLIGTLRIASTGGALSHTMDEPEHFGAGMQWLSGGAYTWDPSHPPLARVLSVVLPYLDGIRYVPAPGSHAEGILLLGSGPHYDRVLALARLGILPLFWVGSLAVYLWARRLAGSMAGVLAVFLFTTMPPVLAHAGLVTTDMAAAGMGAAAYASSLCWAEAPTRGRTLLFGATLGLAALAKFSLLAYLPAGWLLLLAWRRPAWAVIRDRLRPLAGAALFGSLVIWAGYRFSFAPPFVPAPELWSGIRSLWHHNQVGHASYVLGERHRTGVWYFFPVALGIKTPLALLILLAWSLGTALRRALGARSGRGKSGPLHIDSAVAYAAGILLVAMCGRINIGVRHVLPIYAPLSVICGIASAELLRRPAAGIEMLRAAGILFLFSAQALSGALGHPDYISYTNEIAWDHPEDFVAESDLDWGQDMKRVAKFLNQVGAKQVAFTPYCMSYLDTGNPFPKVTPTDWYHPLPGWNVISLSGWKVFDHPGWVKGRKPQVRIGHTHWAWYFP
jgi:hypothetical protein